MIARYLLASLVLCIAWALVGYYSKSEENGGQVQ
jgi:hypothetical protein